MIYFGAPAFFVEATDRLDARPTAAHLPASAGPFMELVIAGIASLVIFAFPEGPLADLLQFALLNYIVIF